MQWGLSLPYTILQNGDMFRNLYLDMVQYQLDLYPTLKDALYISTLFFKKAMQFIDNEIKDEMKRK